ncbi:PAS domain S-box protein [Jannaschia sp. Os4]|uniref:PAS domain S-box protein n=1 Tax=Jannaschia sp. Os4 TaxID=2807617 RepID=UPI00193A8EA8|nr:PAS domain S-box protein [Jannaschia sp. Os4]MBM2575873.1 PAS domain S-box protein [Jannaschia sp. Os4]
MDDPAHDGTRIDADLLPCGIAGIDGEGRVTFANAALRDWLGREGQDLEGTRLLDLLTPAGRIYFETHLRPLLAVQGEFAEVAIELRRRDGTRIGVTMAARAEAADGTMRAARICVHRNEQRRAYERELLTRRIESERFAATVRSAPDAIIVIASDGRIEAWNPAATALFGWTEAEATGRRLDDLLVPADEPPLPDAVLAAIRAGEDLHDEVERLHRDGRSIPVRRSVAEVRDPVGRSSGRVVTYGDISEQRRARARVDVLVRELAHRTKNILAIVGVVARQTARHHAGADFTAAFDARLSSLSRNQDLLTVGGGERADLGALILGQLRPLDAGARIATDGPAVDLGPRAAQAVGMAIYELGTNAAKYGALSTPAGRLSVTWRTADGRLRLDWAETGGPPVSPPVRRGFGSRVTGALLDSALAGRATHDYAPGGLRWRLDAPLARLAD